MIVNKICLYNNRNSYKTYGHNSEKQTIKQSEYKTTSYNEPAAADAIKVFKTSNINFSGHVENILIWKPANTEKKYYAKLDRQQYCKAGNSADAGVHEAIKYSGVCNPDARIDGHVENSDVDYFGPLTKSVYFADPNEKIYNGIKSSYDYVVYAPGAYDDENDSDFGDAYDTVSDWESFGWIDAIGPSWL